MIANYSVEFAAHELTMLHVSAKVYNSPVERAKDYHETYRNTLETLKGLESDRVNRHIQERDFQL